MNWDLLLPLLVTAIVASVGWFVAHRLSVARDRVNRRRELRTEYLIEAYRRLAKSSDRDVLHPYADLLESAIADIHLFGTQRQVELARSIVDELAAEYGADVDDLLNDLRAELRAELDLPPVRGNLRQIRITPHRLDDES